MKTVSVSRSVPFISVVAVLAIFVVLQSRAAETAGAGGIPAEIQAVPGTEISVYFRNLTADQSLPPPESISVDCPVGKVTKDRWYLPSDTAAKPGIYPLHIQVSDRKIESAVRVVPSDQGAGLEGPIRLLIVGDSLTNATHYPNEIARLFARPGNPDVIFTGSHKPPRALENVVHEGYGGWTWERFVSKFESGNEATDKTRNSPFLFLQNNHPSLDFGRYFAEQSKGATPDFVTVLLGINDCFHPDPNDPGAVTARIDKMLANAEIFLAALRKAAPNCQIGICLTTPPNLREEAFQANYKGRYTQAGWRKIQFELVRREVAHFSGREKENLFIVPTSLNLDPINGYPTDNAVHPNESGYAQIAASIYNWIKSRL